MVVLMGSGELTATMVEVHKELLKGLGASPQAVFIDTPAGFQLTFISQARDILRDMLALLGTRLSSSPKSEAECLAPLVEQLLDLREFFRQQKNGKRPMRFVSVSRRQIL